MSEVRWIVTEHLGAGGLAALEDDWRTLYAQMPNPAVWHSHEAYSAYLAQLCPAPERFRCYVLSDGERVRAILPIEERVDRSFRMPLRVWGMPWHQEGGWLTSDAIGPEDDARRALLPLVIERLRHEPGRPALLVLGRTRDASALWDGLAGYAPSSLFAFADGGEYVVPTDMSLDAFMRRLSRNSRSILSRAARKFEMLDGATYALTATHEDLAAAYESLLEVEASGWKGRRGSAIRQQPRIADFYRDLLGRLTLDGRCEIHALHAEGRCIAASLCVHTGRERAMLKCGYDESYAHVSPGRLLNHKAIERSCEDPGIDAVNLSSTAPWMRHWMPATNGIRRAYVLLRPVSGGLLLAALRFRYGPVRRGVRTFKTWKRDRDDGKSARRGRDAVSFDTGQNGRTTNV
jgi:hypothetical protein